MSIPQILSDQLTTYFPAELHTGKCWYVNYYAFNPYTQRMEEVRKKVNRIKSIPERRKFCQELKKEINKKLESGWNPFVKTESKKQFDKFITAIEIYKKSEYKDFESETIRTYDSYLNRLIEFSNRYDKNLFCGSFTERMASDLMMELKLDDNIGSRTYNNNLLFFRRFFVWLIDKKFTDSNPFLTIKTVSKKKIKSNRKALTREQIKELITFLEVEHPRYLAACMLQYYCLIRPDDLQVLQKCNFDFERKVLIIKKDVTKNDHESLRVIPDALMPFLKELEIDKMSSFDYIFSEHSQYKFTEGNRLIDKRYFGKYWSDRVRPALKFGSDLQFYSLKYSGITYMMSDGVSPIFVQKQADHSNLETTMLYADKNIPEGFDQIQKRSKAI